ncbi:MAG: DUF4920 domain-containing protein [Ferruginibacter sp.]|nr:DUF4920 domain-containing protein [Ferruginibacter sp.]
MKKITTLFVAMLFSFALMAQPPQMEITKGMTFGARMSQQNALNPNELVTFLQNTPVPKEDIKVRGEVIEVCKEEGCWIRLKTNDGSIFVKFKDHAFLVPLSLVGHTVEVEGAGSVKEMSVDQLRHFAEDAGKSKEEIDAITQPKKETMVKATALAVLD